MSIVGTTLVVLISFLHLYIMFFEMFLWTSRGPKIFSNLAKNLFEPTKSMAANQGLYNGFLAAGLLWSIFIQDPQWQKNIAICFLLFVLIAGIYGTLTVSRKIILVQAIPATIALLAVIFNF